MISFLLCLEQLIVGNHVNGMDHQKTYGPMTRKPRLFLRYDE